MQLTSSGLQIGPLTITLFSLIVVFAVTAGAAVTSVLSRRETADSTLALDLGTSALFFGLLMGRLFYVITPPPSAAPYYTRDWYFSHPLDLLAGPVAIWNGGLGPAGAIVGALIGALLVLRGHRVDLWRWAEILLPGMLCAATILPWANLAEGQMLGPATNLPWGVAPGGTDVSSLQRFHPTPAYVSAWALIVLLGAIYVKGRFGKTRPDGVWSVLAGAAYFLGLFLADLLRVDASRPLLGLSGVQILCIVAEIALAALLWRRWKPSAGITGSVTEFTEN